MIPHEKAMVDRLRDKPFALIGINSDGDRAVSKQLDATERAALRALGKSEDEVIERLRTGDAALSEKARTAAPGLEGKIRDADVLALRGILEKNGITWRQAVQRSTSGPLPRRWNVGSWPTIYVLDSKGVIRFRNLRDAELQDAAIRLLDEMKGTEDR
jgi:hypothetical protein